MTPSRREVLKQAGFVAVLVGCGAMSVAQAQAVASGWDAKTLDEALGSLGAKAADSKAVTITSPEIAENGAVVPITVASTLPKTEAIWILVEKNPFPLTAEFTLPEGTEPSVTTRVKMGETSRIVAVVKADGKLYSTARETKVTLGGCGG